MDKTAQYEAHSTYKYSSWTTYYKEEMGGARNMHGRDDKITKHFLVRKTAEQGPLWTQM